MVMAVISVLSLVLLVGRGAEKYVGLYLFFLIMALVSGVVQGEFYFKGYALSFVTLSSFAFYFITKSTIANKPWNVQRVEDILLLHVYLSMLQLPMQLTQIIFAYGFSLSIFASDASAGDIAYGTLGHASFLADKAVLSFILIQAISYRFSMRARLAYSGFVLASLLIVGSNHTLIAFGLAIIFGLIFAGGLSFRGMVLKAKYVAIVALVTLLYSIYFEQQMQIVQSGINIALDKLAELPRIKSYIDTLEIFHQNPILAVFGFGMGSYSSRASFILSGTYLWGGVHPLLGMQMSKFFELNLLPLWNLEMRENVHLLGTIWQPFSFYATILSEYGIFIFFAALVCIGKLLLISRNVDIYARWALIFFLIMCFTDNFVEYPNIAIPFVIYLTYAFQKEVRADKNAAQTHNAIVIQGQK